jgi:hypothetical protein
MVYRHCLSSGPGEQQKKVDLAGNPVAQRRLELEVFLQPADVVPNVGTKSGGREEEEGMNEPRAPRRGLYSGRGRLVAAGPRETLGRPAHPWPPSAPRGNPRALGLGTLAGLVGLAYGPSPFHFSTFSLIN